MDIVPSRIFNMLYIPLDIIFLITLAVILIATKRHIALYVGLMAGILYFIVDYGIFYKILHARTVTGGSPLGVLLWLSMSYGFTNFVWMWLWLDEDGHSLEWSILIISGWITVSLLAQKFGSSFSQVMIMRKTVDYHGVMALILFIGYAILCIKNIKQKNNIPILRILIIGILVQFSWESVLLITGIRGGGINTLIVNSLIETNLGMPYLYFIHKAVKDKCNKKSW